MPPLRKLDSELIRERCSYPQPTPDRLQLPASKYEWKFSDRYGNRFGRLCYRLAGSPSDSWHDVFDQEVHQSEFVIGSDFAVAAVADGLNFTIYKVSPPSSPVEIYRQEAKLELNGLSSDGNFLLVLSSQDGNWFRPELLVLDLRGEVLARLGEFGGAAGCYPGSWSPCSSDFRIVFHYEGTGFSQPAVWYPFENRVEDFRTELPGEVYASWDKVGESLILKRCLEGRSDLHRLNLSTRKLESLQPLDGTVFRYSLDAQNRVVGLWSAGHRYAEHFCEQQRSPIADYRPSVPLDAWQYRRIAGVPCFMMTPAGGARWTIFDVYGSYPFHHTDSYYSRIQCYVDHGFRVVQVNARGCNGFGRSWREATFGKIGFTELEDLSAVRDALIAEGVVDGGRTIIQGDSWGGYLTLLAMCVQPELWQMGVAFAPIADFSRLAKDATPITWAATRNSFLAKPEDLATALCKASPISYVDTIRHPVLIVTGSCDLLCPPGQNAAFANAVLAKNSECEMHVFEGGHGAPSREERIRHISLMLEFLLRKCEKVDAMPR